MTNDQDKGLKLNIYRLDGQTDRTNGGISSQVNMITMTTAHIRGNDYPAKTAPEFHLWARVNGGIGPGGAAWVSADDLPMHELQENNTHLFLAPAGQMPQMVKFHDIFAYTSDDRFTAISKYPIPILDKS